MMSPILVQQQHLPVTANQQQSDFSVHQFYTSSFSQPPPNYPVFHPAPSINMSTHGGAAMKAIRVHRLGILSEIVGC